MTQSHCPGLRPSKTTYGGAIPFLFSVNGHTKVQGACRIFTCLHGFNKRIAQLTAPPAGGHSIDKSP